MQGNFTFRKVMCLIFMIQIIRGVVHAVTSINYNCSTFFSVTNYNCI